MPALPIERTEQMPKGLTLPLSPTLHPDEPVRWVAEAVLVPPDYKARHRYRMFCVVRNGQEASYIEDLGLAPQGSDEGFHVHCEWQHTAQEARDLATEQAASTRLRDFLAEKQQESTLVEDYIKQKYERQQQARNRSVNGPYISVERSNNRSTA